MDDSVFASRQEKEDADREGDPYRRDVEKILYSKAYARYADKTQVVYLFPHDHIASRALHVQLVSFLSRGIGRKLGLHSDLIEAISLGHDMGHAPFGHEGEGYLHELSVAAGLGAFSHSRQSCRVASEIEPMNLTFATLDGFLCHDGGMENPVISVEKAKTWAQHTEEMESRLQNPESDLAPMTREAAVVKISDTVSYLERDLEDAITLGIVDRNDVPNTVCHTPGSSITAVVADDIVCTYVKTKMIGVSDEVFGALQQIRSFNFERIYSDKRLKTESGRIRTVYHLLFDRLLQEWKQEGRNSLLWRHFLHSKRPSYVEGYVAEQLAIDYIAGMTDGYFLRLFRELFLPRAIDVPDILPFSQEL